MLGRPRTPALLLTAALAATGLPLLAGAGPADAVSGTLTYHCTTSPNVGDHDFTAVVDTNAPATLGSGLSAAINVTSDVTVPDSLATALRDVYHAATVDGTSQTTGTVAGVSRTSTLAIPRTSVPASGTPMHVIGAGPGGSITAGAAGTSILLGAGNFTATLTGYSSAGTVVLPPTTFTCVLTPPTGQNLLVDTVNVVPAPTTTAVAVQPTAVEYGAQAVVSAEVAQTGSNAKPAGTVAFTFEGKTFNADVKGGKAKADLPVALTMGAQQVTAVFTPTDKNLAPSQASANLSVVRAATTTTGKAVYRDARNRLVGKATVAAVYGTDVAGAVKFVLKRNGSKIAIAKVDLNKYDKARTVFRHVSKAGQYTLVTRYLGSPTLRRSTDKVSITV